MINYVEYQANNGTHAVDDRELALGIENLILVNDPIGLQSKLHQQLHVQ